MRVVRPEPALQLALLRVVVPAMILLTPEVRHAAALAGAPAALRVAPEGLGWFVAWVPIQPAVATGVQGVCAFSALCAIAGVRARVALTVLTVSAFYLFALSQLSGAVWHDMHLLWMSALLAASPCDEALAYDRRGQPPAPDSLRYAWPLTFARLLLAGVYFFPGLHKLMTSGLAWALSDNLRNQLWWKWAEHGVTPALRVDHAPGLLGAGALFVLLFELSFPVLALVPRTRPWAAVAGLAFHLFAATFLRIPFVSLWATYVVLVDPRALVPRRWRRAVMRAPPEAAPSPPLRATLLVGPALLVGVFAQGLRGQTRAFPFACYPTFEFMAPAEMPDLEIEVETAAGERLVVPHARDARGYRTQRQWGQIWSLAGVTSPVEPARLKAYLDEVSRTEPARSLVKRGVRARFDRVYLSVVPEERGRPPLDARAAGRGGAAVALCRDGQAALPQRRPHAALHRGGRQREVLVALHPAERVAHLLAALVGARLADVVPLDVDRADGAVGGAAQVRLLLVAQHGQRPVEEVKPNVPCAASSRTMRPSTARGSGCRAACHVPRSSGIESASPTQKKRTTSSRRA